MTLWARLTEAHQRGLIRRDGTGHATDPFRYYLPEKVDKWKNEPIHQLEEQHREDLKNLAMLGIEIGWRGAARWYND